MKINLLNPETVCLRPHDSNADTGRIARRNFFQNWMIEMRGRAIKRMIVISLLSLFLTNKALADYTIPFGTTVDAATLIATLTPAQLSGTLTINGTLTVSGNGTVNLLGYTAVVINGNAGNINWLQNADLHFSANTTVDVNNPGNFAGVGLLPIGGSASASLVIGTTVIAVSNSNSQNAPYSFADFNNAGGLPQFTITASPTSLGTVCFGTTFTVTIGLSNDNIVPFNCTWSTSVAGVNPSPASATAFTTPQTTTITPKVSAGSLTYTVSCTLYRNGDPGNDPIITKQVNVVVAKVDALPTTPTITAGGLTTFCSGGSVTLTSSTGSSYLWSTGATTASISPTTSGSYTVQVKNASGCQSASSAPKIVTVTALPAAPTITAGGPLSFCTGGSVTLTSSAGSSYLWSTGATTASISPATSGSYTVQVKNASGCQSASSAATVVTVNPKPTISVTASTVCGGAPATIVATPGTGVTSDYNYAWTFPATATNPGSVATFNSAITGNYSVVITNTATGCVSAASPAANVVAASNNWTGINSSDWQDVANWSCAAVPTAISDVIIPSVAPHMPMLTQASFTKSLELQGSAVVTLNGQTLNNVGGIKLTGTGLGSFIGSPTSSISINAPGTSSIINLNQGTDGTTNALNNLTINGSGASATLNSKTAIYGILTPALGMLNINSELVLRSTAASTAMVGQVGGTIVYGGAGIVNVERYFPPTRNWRMFTAPVSGGGSIFDNWQNGGLMSAVAPGKGTLITGNIVATGPAGNGLDVGAPNVKTSLEEGVGNQQLIAVANTHTENISYNTGTSADNKPFFIFVRGDRNVANFLPQVSAPTTLSSKGKLQTGTQTFDVNPVAGSFTMIGNPYASPVDFTGLDKTSLPHNLYVWDPTLRLTGAYVTFLETSPGNYLTAPSAYAGAASTIIQSGQSFYVNNSTGGPASLIFDESAKSTTNNQAIFNRTMNLATSKTSLVTNLYAFTNSDSMFLVDGNLAEFDESYNAGVDWQDAKKMTNVDETLGLLCNGVSLVADRRPLVTGNDTMVYTLTKTTARKYQFELITTNLNKDNLAGFLQDRFTGTATPVDMNGITKVNFEVTADQASSAADRFKLVFQQLAVPVANSVPPTDIGVLSVVSVFPNPVSDNTIHLQINGMAKGLYVATLMNNLGQPIFNNTMEHLGGTSIKTIQLANRPGAGTYQLRIMAPDKKITTIKVVVQ